MALKAVYAAFHKNTYVHQQWAISGVELIHVLSTRPAEFFLMPFSVLFVVVVNYMAFLIGPNHVTVIL